MPVRLLVALAAGLALADASIVTLALPPIIAELDASVEGAAVVLGVYTLVLALALPPAAWLRRATGTRGLGAAGLGLFAAASVACGLAESLELLVAARAVQAVGAATALVAGFALLDAGRPGPGRSLWAAAAVLGIAIGPALGGALTQGLDWRAIFLVQAPVAALAALAAAVAQPEPQAGAARAAGAGGAAAGAVAAAPPPEAPPEPRPFGPAWAAAGLALLSAALVGVLFLLVLLLISGWSLSPLGAAAVVSVLPAAALLALRVPGHPRTRAACGCVLVGAGILALAFLPTDEIAWTIGPQVVAGAGMGLALPALAGELLPERTPWEAARLLSARHVGITVALAVLAPIAADELDAAVVDTRERGAALVLDARLPPIEKIELASELAAELDPVDPRGSLSERLEANAGRFDEPEERAEYARLRTRAEEVLVRGVNDAFATGFLITGGLALLGALVVRPPARPRAVLAFAVALATLALPAGQALAQPSLAPDPVELADPCAGRDLPSTGGLTGALQDAVLASLDQAACRFGSTREELVIALVDDQAGREYEQEYGVNPREASELLGPIIGLLD